LLIFDQLLMLKVPIGKFYHSQPNDKTNLRLCIIFNEIYDYWHFNQTYDIL